MCVPLMYLIIQLILWYTTYLLLIQMLNYSSGESKNDHIFTNVMWGLKGTQIKFLCCDFRILPKIYFEISVYFMQVQRVTPDSEADGTFYSRISGGFSSMFPKQSFHKISFGYY